jgi:LmbE family N-acetylglucosaminyl deacetylase
MNLIAPTAGHRTEPLLTVSPDQLIDRLGATPPTVVGVWAHPDDESFLAGGLLAGLARRGSRIVTVSATAGEHGLDHGRPTTPGRLAPVRVRELDEALGLLGADPALHLGYADGGCDQVTERLAAHLIGQVLDDVAADLVISFGPGGVTGHPDHCAVGRWTQRAVAARGDRTPLLTVANQQVWSADETDRLDSIGAFWPDFPDAASRPTGPTATVRLDRELTTAKLAAVWSHASQVGPVAGALGHDGLRRLASRECYVAANTAARRHLTQEPAAIDA